MCIRDRPRYRDLPAVGLYLDQTVQYVNACFRTFCGVELLSLIHIYFHLEAGAG